MVWSVPSAKLLSTAARVLRSAWKCCWPFSCGLGSLSSLTFLPEAFCLHSLQGLSSEETFLAVLSILAEEAGVGCI